MHWLGIDIGGANLKAAQASGWTACMPFPLWRQPEQLSSALQQLAQQAPQSERVQGWAVTMTGELADCYTDKSHGVREIVAAAELAAAALPVRYYSTDGSWLAADLAVQHPLRVAASNWHALASWVARQFPTSASLLIDAGSTTVDIIPIAGGRSVSRGLTDWTRLLSAELVYTGVERTPVSIVLPVAELLGTHRPAIRLAAELFATMKDVYIVLGDLPGQDHDCDTADGRPATRDYALMRLRRLVCADPSEVPDAVVEELARQAAVSQVRLLSDALQQVLAVHANLTHVVVSGHGGFLVRRALTAAGWTGGIQSLGEQWSAEVARSAPAYAVACLADAELTSAFR